MLKPFDGVAAGGAGEAVGVVADVAAPASVRAYWVERSLVER
jgi:hypothetical protein